MSVMREVGYPGTLLCQATTELISVAAMIDCMYDQSTTSMELLEAKRAIHNALVALNSWGGFRSAVAPTPALARMPNATKG